jgi:hypothetical protein
VENQRAARTQPKALRVQNEEEKEEKKMEKKEEEEEDEVDKNHATSPRLLTPAGVSSLSSLFRYLAEVFFFTSRSPTSPHLLRRMVFRVCVCVSVAPLCGGCWKRKKTAFGLFAFGTFSSSSLPFCSEFSSRFASFLPFVRSFACLPPVL